VLRNAPKLIRFNLMN